MTLDLRALAQAIGASEAPTAQPIQGYSTDSRTVQAGDLFFALHGPAHDAHAYIEQVRARGAAAVVVDRPVPTGGLTLTVPDTLIALQQAAALARRQFSGAVVGVTGSAGKTSTKDIIAALLGAAFPVGKTQGNFNNHVGLPLSLLRLPDEAQAAVLELGMNHAGEIRDLSAIAEPQIGVVTNVGWAHIENFAGIADIAAAKRELVEALPADGLAVLNADDERVIAFARHTPAKIRSFGLSPQAEFRAEEVAYSTTGAAFRVGSVQFETALPGRHGVLNILAGLAVAAEFGIAPETLQEPVRGLQPGKMRGERFVRHGITIFNDCYNSNPDALHAMLDLLRDTPAQRRVAVLGEMLELGHWAGTLHREAGTYAARCGISVLIGIRGAAKELVEAAQQAGLARDAAYFFSDPAEAGSFLQSIAQPGDAILFKGSRGTRVELALERFLG